MTRCCKIWCAGTVVAIAGLATAAGWYFTRPRPEPIVTQPDSRAASHASAPQLLAAAAERLHQEALAHFHADPQNGRSRMPFVYEKVVREWKTPWFSTGELDRDEPLPFAKDMTLLHQASRKDFLTPPMTEATENAAPLAFGIIWDQSKYDASKKVWEPKSVDLIGLLKSETPVVYVSEKVAHPKDGEEAATRPVDEFELAALTALSKGENLFGRTRDGVIRLVGAVRAEESCLACHRNKSEGDLLGAFSYTLREAQYRRQGGWPGRPIVAPAPVVEQP